MFITLSASHLIVMILYLLPIKRRVELLLVYYAIVGNIPAIKYLVENGVTPNAKVSIYISFASLFI